MNGMKAITADKNLTAFCGLYCGACKAFLREKCAGCRESEKRSWCKVRTCCIERSFTTCADCKDFPDPTDCRKFNNFISKLFGLIFRSDRRACILQIRDIGLQGHADRMAKNQLHSIRR